MPTKWNSPGQTPRAGAKIVFEMFGFMFNGVYHGAASAGGGSWSISYKHFNNQRDRWPVSVRDIKRWSYR